MLMSCLTALNNVQRKYSCLVSEKEKNHRLVTGTKRGKEKLFVIMRVFSPHHQLMIFPENQCSKYYVLHHW